MRGGELVAIAIAHQRRQGRVGNEVGPVTMRMPAVVSRFVGSYCHLAGFGCRISACSSLANLPNHGVPRLAKQTNHILKAVLVEIPSSRQAVVDPFFERFED